MAPRSSKRKRKEDDDAHDSTASEEIGEDNAGDAAVDQSEVDKLDDDGDENPSGKPFTDLQVQWQYKRYHLKDRAHKVMIYGYETIGGDIKKVLTTLSVGAAERVRKSALGCYTRLDDYSTKCGLMIHYIVMRQVTPNPNFDPTSMFFRIGNKVLRCGRFEFALVSGLRFGPANFNPYTRHELPANSVFERLFGARPETNSADVHSAYTSMKFKVGRNAVNASEEDYVKLTKVLIALSCVMGFDNSKKKIPLWIWVLIENEKEWEEFPWGSLSYQMTYDFVNKVAELDRKSSRINLHFRGNAIALLGWMFEAIAGFGTIVGLKKDDRSKPRFLRYSYVKERSYPTENQIQEILVQTLKPYKGEVSKPYWKSLEQDTNVEEFAFQYDAFASKKKAPRDDVEENEDDLPHPNVVAQSAPTNYVTLSQIDELMKKYVKEIGDYVVAQILAKAPEDLNRTHDDSWMHMEHGVHAMMESGGGPVQATEVRASDLEKGKGVDNAREEAIEKEAHVPTVDNTEEVRNEMDTTGENVQTLSNGDEVRTEVEQKGQEVPTTEKTASPDKDMVKETASEQAEDLPDEFFSTPYIAELFYGIDEATPNLDAAPTSLYVPHVETSPCFPPISSKCVATIRGSPVAPKPPLPPVQPRAARSRFPSKACRSPFDSDVERPGIDLFDKFLKNEDDEKRDVGLPYSVDKEFFESMIKQQSLVNEEHVNSYLSLLATKPTLVGLEDVDDTIAVTWTNLLSDIEDVFDDIRGGKHTLAPYNFDLFDPSIEEIVSKEGMDKLLIYANGNLPNWGACLKKWIHCEKVVTICNIDDHYTALVIDLKEQQLVVHDPKRYQLTDDDIYNRRCFFLPMARLIPQMMKAIGYFERHTTRKPCYGQWEIHFGPKIGHFAYQQVFEEDAAFYCMKFVERFLSKAKTAKGMGTRLEIKMYRRHVARSIYLHSKSVMTVENIVNVLQGA